MASPQPLDITELIKHKVEGTRPQAPDEVINGFVIGSGAALVAPGGVGKTFYILNLLHILSLGCELWHPFYASKEIAEASTVSNGKMGKVLYINLEDPAIVLENRVFDLIDAISEGEACAIQNSAVILPHNGFQFCLLNADGTRNKFQVDSLKTRLKNEGYRLLILDTLRRTHLADENNGGHMAALLCIFEEIAREFEIGVLFAHHCNKLSILNGNGDIAQAARGSVVLVDNVRFQINLCGLSSEECQSDHAVGIFQTPVEAASAGVKQLYRGYFVRSCGSKINNAQPGSTDFWYWRGPGGVLHRILTPTDFAKRWWEKIGKRQVLPKGGGDGKPSRKGY